MKKSILILLAIALVFSFSSCKNDDSGNTVTDEHGHVVTTSSESGSGAHTHNPEGPALSYADKLPLNYTEYADEDEFVKYDDMFIKKNFQSYENKSLTVTGIFCVLKNTNTDALHYFVWGYKDTAKTSCYQWEIVLPEGVEAPAAGSLVEVSGTMTKEAGSIDSYRLTDTSLTVKEEATPSGFELDFLTLSPTLRRVQLQYIVLYANKEASYTARAGGKALSENTLGDTDPILNSDWSVHFTASKDHLDADSQVVVEGNLKVEPHTDENGVTHYSVFIESQKITVIG